MTDFNKTSNGMKYIDIHCHLPARTADAVQSGGDFINQGNLEEILLHMKEREVGAITIGTDLETSKKAIEIANENENIWATIGIHPEGIFSKSYGAGPEIFISEKSENTISALGQKDKALETVFSDFSELVKNPKVVAIGECGLEYFVMKKEETEKLQKNLFIKQIEFAIKYDKPLMLHLRPSKGTQDAYFESLEILKSYKREVGEKLRGNVHFFAGNIEVAREFLDLGFAMSFTGVITFPPGRIVQAGTPDYDEVIKYIPQNSIMSETDAPFVAPVPYRGKRNEPAYVTYVVERMAEIREEKIEILKNSILANFRRVFEIKNL